ncbi:MAG: extracellular solute-binding protein [Oscillospiraceae bacterium]|nr:extracellular solute-binding protein [Oscillospiraceae bacterium]
MKKTLFRFSALFICAAILVTSGGVAKADPDNPDGETAQTAAQGLTSGEDSLSDRNVFTAVKNTYVNYLENIKGIALAKNEIELTPDNASLLSEGAMIETGFRNNTNQAVILKQDEYAEWTIEVPSAAVYAVEVKYTSYQGKSGSTVTEMYIDGELPFREAGYLEFHKMWENSPIEEDSIGNDMSSLPTEKEEWQLTVKRDPARYTTLPMRVALSEGVRTIRFNVISDNMAIEYIKLIPVPEYMSYAEYRKSVDHLPDNALNLSDEENVINIEAELSSFNSDISITPRNDPVSPFTTPQDAGRIKLNTIGSTKWQVVGSQINWEFSVKESGNYKISFRARQKDKVGIFVSRSLLINGETPFEEARNLQFEYNDNWYRKTVEADGQEALFYFEKDTPYILTLEVDLGEMSETLSRLENVLTNLNQAYLEMFMIVGTTPDIYRDYEFDRIIPETLKSLKQQSDTIKEITERIEEFAKKSDYTALLNRMTFQLDNMVDKPHNIAANFNDYKTNIGALGTWVNEARNQPLELDMIYIVPSGTEVPSETKNFFTSMWFSIKRFFYSFTIDYSMVARSPGAEEYDKQIKVWVVTGRDQAQIIRRMADETFSKQHEISVDLELISGGTLLPSILSGVGPDVSLMNGQGDPVNYAVRNAVLDLSQFPDLDDVLERFHPNSYIPYRFHGGTYGLPETLSFSMFFYRTDIFAALGIDVPNTWDDLVKLIPTLSRNNMQIGFPSGMGGLQLALFQRGIDLYKEEGRYTNLDSDEALQAFSDMCDIFTMYRAPIAYDFSNRFRTGEMPCAIQDYMAYNQLNLFAPEIRGLWSFVPMPGVVKPDGSFERTSVAGTGSTMIMSNTKDADSSWEFVKWWLSAETQSRFAIELESVLGPSAKYATANIEAFDNLTWTSRERNNILEQMRAVKAVPEVPGGYYTGRIVEFAFSRVYNRRENPTETMNSYIDELNEELHRKRREFGLN